MIAIPNTLITINPQHPSQFPRGLLPTDWQFAMDVLHPCDQEPVVQAGHLVTERALQDLRFAGCDEVQVERVDWDAEDAALQQFLDQPAPSPLPKVQAQAQPTTVWPFPVSAQPEVERPTVRITKPDTYVGIGIVGHNPSDYTEHTLTQVQVDLDEMPARDVAARIDAMPAPLPEDARRCAKQGDWSGLTYIVNMTLGQPGSASRSAKLIGDLVGVYALEALELAPEDTFPVDAVPLDKYEF